MIVSSHFIYTAACICNNDVVNCKYVWYDKLKDCFKTNLATGDTLNRLQFFNVNVENAETEIDIDNCITELPDFIIDVTTPFKRNLISSSTVFSNNNNNKNNNNNSKDYSPSNDQPWFSEECFEKRHIFYAMLNIYR